MAMSVVYTNFGGEIVSENRGGVEREYMPDTLGNTVALLDSSQNKTDTWTYWPYGEVKSRTGTNPTPFTYVGTLGYYKDELTRLYVRARYLRVDLGQWMTVDPMWPREEAYIYVSARPLYVTDRAGLGSCKIFECTVLSSILKHRYICVQGPSGGCSGGIYYDEHGDRGYGNSCEISGETSCKLIGESCAQASQVCACLRRARKSTRHIFLQYLEAGTCYGFPRLMACCGCGAFKGKEFGWCRKDYNCDSCTIRTEPSNEPGEQVGPGETRRCGLNLVVG